MQTLKLEKKEIAKPFLKWAGGKTQLIKEIKKQLPSWLSFKKFTYIEPFVGSGAILFWMLNKYPNLENAIINDINSDLTNSYLIVKNDPKSLISILKNWQSEFHKIYADKEKAKEYYYSKRELFNQRNTDKITQAALFIFLNKTCFNGLFRVNNKNLFNVPIGRSSSLPAICNENNIMLASRALQKVEILNGDYTETLSYVGKYSFFYFDPPYKPLSQTSSFNSYAIDEFNDEEQIRLKEFCEKLHKQDIQWILSNSDVKNISTDNSFFDDLYSKFIIQRVKAYRTINSIGTSRGSVNELLIRNYE